MKPVKRRTALKAIGGTVGLMGVQPVNAENSGKQEFVGVTYNPVTNHPEDLAEGKINRVNNDKVRGKMKINGKTIPLNDKPMKKEFISEKIGPADSGNVGTFSLRKKGKDNRLIQGKHPLHVEMTSVSRGAISGIIGNDPSSKEAFILQPVSPGKSKKDIREEIKKSLLKHKIKDINTEVYND
ncbi:hypothetical protein G3A49_13435 [Haloferax volcanii]|uniref:Uncharacterized protein n=1 Tax=Haloferax volcanii TaxID=2246 RepID=A0A6C0UZ38_HALVO|nr:hypothetical protein [Haloferax alexandrinus]QIB79079.1 hypothetical protein G3A49_13435 [Haloferax alexandrinus]